MAGLVCPGPQAKAAETETNAAVVAPLKAPEPSEPAVPPAYVEQLQDQQKAILRAVEQSRQDADERVRRSSEFMTGRLSAIEQSLASERQRELEVIQKWNLFTLIVVGGFASLGFIGLLLVGLSLGRALNRLTDVASTLRVRETSGLGGFDTDAALLTGPMVGQANARLLEGLERVERRIQELEQAVQPQLPPPAAHSNGGAKSLPASAEPALGSRPLTAHDRADVVLQKGEGLLQLGQEERALDCFEEAIALDPESAEAHVKKGKALEKLQRPEEALACYNRAIALDKKLRGAYLAKGALCNQLARYNEAVECYEQALRVPEEHRALSA